MNILVTGATGFIGRRLCHRLHKDGHTVTILSRRGKDARPLFHRNTTTVRWDALEEDFPIECLEGIDSVINLSGEGIADKRWSKSRKWKIYDSRILGTRRLVDAVSKQNGAVKRFISASATGWYGDRGDDVLTEESRPGEGFLATVCRAWETEAQRLPSVTRSIQVRIGVVIGANGGMLQKVLPLFKMGLGGHIGSGNQWMSWIHIDDLISMFLFLLKEESASGIYNGVSPDPVTNWEFAKTLGRVISRPALIPTPGFALKLAMGESSTLVLSSQRVMPERVTSLGFEFQFPELRSALSEATRAR